MSGHGHGGSTAVLGPGAHGYVRNHDVETGTGRDFDREIQYVSRSIPGWQRLLRGLRQPDLGLLRARGQYRHRGLDLFRVRKGGRVFRISGTADATAGLDP